MTLRELSTTALPQSDAAATSAVSNFLSAARAYVWLLPATLFVVSAARAVGVPAEYSVGHWLQHYGYGFIKRGLPGTLIKPLVDHREGVEIRLLLGYLTIIILVVSVGAIVRAIQQLLAGGQAGARVQGAGVWLVSLGAAIAFAASPFSRNLGFLIGYFDHLLVIATLLSLALVRSNHWLLAGLVGAAAMLSHELYLVVGLPSVALACWLKLHGEEGTRWVRMTHAVGIPLLVGLAILVAAENLSAAALASLRAEIIRGVALGSESVTASTAHLAEPLVETFAAEAHGGWSRLLRPSVLNVTWPSFVVLLGAAVALAYRFGGRIACVLALGAVFAPLAAHFVAFDSGRITGFALFGAFTALYVAVIFAPRREARPVAEIKRARRGWLISGTVVVLLGAASVAWTCTGPIYPVSQAVYDLGVFSPREAPSSGHPRCDRKLFDNSDFEKQTLENWSVRGEGWPTLPVANAKQPNARLTEGAYAYTTPSSVPGSPPTMAGQLSSREFAIEGRHINFLLDGQGPVNEVSVSLFVLGYPVRSAAANDPERDGPVIWNVEALKGYPATLVVVDRSLEGYVTVDRFCYAD